MLRQLKIDPEFQSKIPPLTFEELNLLETNILEEGRILSPLIVWNGLIVDGHNRFAILKNHPEIKYTILEKEFANRYEAIVWICKNQLGRRNLKPEQFKYLLGQQYEAEKLATNFNGNRFTPDKYSIPEEELIAWSETSLKGPLPPEAFNRCRELFNAIFPEESKTIFGIQGETSKKVVIIVKDGMVDFAYISKELHEVVVKIIDMDTTEPRSERTALIRKKRVKKQIKLQ